MVIRGERTFIVDPLKPAYPECQPDEAVCTWELQLRENFIVVACRQTCVAVGQLTYIIINNRWIDGLMISDNGWTYSAGHLQSSLCQPCIAIPFGLPGGPRSR